jgi:DNA polymerase
MTTLRLDYESKSEEDLKVKGLDIYSSHPSTKIILCSFVFDNDSTPELWDSESGKPFPKEVRRALESKDVVKKAFNAQFERVMTKRVLGIDTPYKNWRCTMALAYSLSFTGGLADVAMQMGLPLDMQKDKRGKQLIQLFCKPQKVTANQPHLWRDSLTNPLEWEDFGEYCVQDTVTERAIDIRLSKFYVPEDEWKLYELDQKINDRGLPIHMGFVNNAIEMSARRKAELKAELKRHTGLANPNSGAQLLKWLKPQGYPFEDLQSDTVKKVLKESKHLITDEAEVALRLRQNASKTSVAKYSTLKKIAVDLGEGVRFRFGFQFAGAQRTQRWGGRRFQAHNLPRTPKMIEELPKLSAATDYIKNNDYEMLSLCVGEPMLALVGCIRSSIQAPEDRILRVCDLSSIETCVIAWLANCKRLLKVIRAGYDPYKDFAVMMYHGCYAAFGTPEYEEAYAKVTKEQRNNSKPPMLGAGYRLGAGEIKAGKKTGLWGYAEGMNIDLQQQECVRSISAYRTGYLEVPDLWTTYERAIEHCLKTGDTVTEGPIQFSFKKPFLRIRLPSGRYLYYFKPRMMRKKFQKETGTDEFGVTQYETWYKNSFTYMGKQQGTNKWTRVDSHGGKIVENLVQAIARDILKYGLLDADEEGFDIVGHVHDEILAQEAENDSYHTVELLGKCMTRSRSWAPGLPLGFGGWEGYFYRKD